MRRGIFAVIFFCFSNFANAQELNLIPVKGLPTNEAYDLFIDSKGFIWVGHALGISRYDGISFTHFQNPQQTSLGMTDICEDKQGRIWCHNFNGQIFYIEHEKMALLKEYDANKEKSFPRMLVFGDDLVVASLQGLFICNTLTFQYKYIMTCGKDSIVIHSLALANNNIISYDGNQDLWFYYSSINGVKRLKFKNETGITLQTDLALSPLITSDTIYASSRRTDNLLYKLVRKNDTIFLKNAFVLKQHLNTLTNCENKIWINTTESSYSLSSRDIIRGYNITDIVVDKEQNKWISSLQNGLLFQSQSIIVKDTKLKGLPNNNLIRCVQKRGNIIVYGTQKGDIIINSISQRTNQQFSLPANAGAVEKIFFTSNNKVLIGASIGLYLIDLVNNELYPISEIGTIKDMLITPDATLFAHSGTLFIQPNSQFKKIIEDTFSIENKREIINSIRVETEALLRWSYLRQSRCYSLAYNPYSETVYAAFKDGIFTYKDKQLRPVLFQHNNIITASSLVNKDNKVYAATFNKGIFIIEGDSIKNINSTNGLLSDVIIQMRLIENDLFIVETNGIQIFDIRKQQMAYTIGLPSDYTGTIYDLWRSDSLIYLSSANNLYQINYKGLTTLTKPSNYLLSVTTSDSEIIDQPHKVLSYYKNSVQFTFSSPSYTYPQSTYFMYRLKGAYDTTWKKTVKDDRSISFVSLKPGDYTFQCYAVNFQNQSSDVISFPFSVSKPWWQQWWFYGLIFLSLSLSAYYLMKRRILAVRKRDNIAIEKLNLQNELRNSSLTAIKAQMNPHFVFNALNTIQSFVYNNDKKSVSNYLGKFSELIRKTLDNSNNERITLQEEIEMLQLYLEIEKMRFTEDLNVHFNIDSNINAENIYIPSMLIQPYVENAIKHGLFHKQGNKELTIKIYYSSQQHDFIEVLIDDNGVGREKSKELNMHRYNHTSFATSATEKRLELINQTLAKKIKVEMIDKKNEWNEPSGTTVIITLPTNIEGI
jgi:two-component sensor histidine kinase